MSDSTSSTPQPNDGTDADESLRPDDATSATESAPGTEPDAELVVEPESQPETDGAEAESEVVPDAEPDVESDAEPDAESAVAPYVAPEGDVIGESDELDAEEEVEQTAVRAAVQAEVAAPEPDATTDNVTDTAVAAVPVTAAVLAAGPAAAVEDKGARKERERAEKAAARQAKVDAKAAAVAAREEASRDDSGSKGGKAVGIALAAVVVLAGAGYVAAHQIASDKVPRGTEVAGVDIGGQKRSEALTTLDEAFSERESAPITLTVDGKSSEVEPASAGLAFDHEAVLDEAGASGSWSPGAVWGYFTGGDDIDPVVTVDDTTFSALLDRIDTEHGVAVREGKVTFEDGEVTTRSPRPGSVVDRAKALDTVRGAFLGTERTVELDVEETQPEIDEQDVADALESFANPAVSAPVTLTSGDVKIVLTPAQFSSALRMVPADGKLEPEVKSEKLAELVSEALEKKGGPKEATVKLVSGKPQVVPGEAGITLASADVDPVFLELLTQTDGQRTAEVKSTPAESDFTTEDAKALGIIERVSSESTQFPHADYRNTNIGRAAELINGTVLKPGETFSMNDIVGERTRANGFTEGFMIADGVFKQDLGGGVSQMATTVFNSMFFAGYEDVEHKAHSFYISRYPVGREATVAWGSVDLKFRNDTDYGVLVEAKVKRSTPGSPGVVTVSMWSTKVWDITSSTGNRYAFTSPKTRTITGPGCEPNAGYGGFDIDVKRYFRKPGSSKLVKTENFHTTYTPSDTVICR